MDILINTKIRGQLMKDGYNKFYKSISDVKTCRLKS